MFVRLRAFRPVAVALLAGALGAGALPSPAFAEVGSQMPESLALSGASAQAAESGELVEVVAERSEYTQTMANPDGTLTLTQSTTPQRVRGADGAWRAVDASLEHRADGSVGPKAAVVQLSFSGGGSGEGMIRLGNERGALTFGWPGKLPEPVLAGATATYPEVFKGVDLQLTATSEGYREVLVVKSAEAAANPQLGQIKLSAKGQGLALRPSPGGGLRAIDEDGNVVFKGPAGQMWDSAGDVSSGPLTQMARTQAFEAPAEDTAGEDSPGAPAAEPEDPSQPGKGDASALLPVQVADGAVTVTPDLGILRGEDTVYPVYIDPPMGVGYSERTVLSSDGDRFWNFEGDYGVGHCSRSGPYYCTTGASYTNRMYYEFAPTKLVGKQVIDATFRAYETWSFDCNPHWVDLKRTDNISEATRWPGPAELDHLGDRDVSAGRGTNCSPDQPDSWIEFHDNNAETDENLRATVRSLADGKISRLTLMLRAKDEGDASAWKRFNQNAELQVTYVPKPGVPTSVGLIPGNGTVQYCSTNAAAPTISTRSDPMMQAMVQTLVAPKSGEYAGSLRAYMDVERSDPAQGWVKSWAATLPTSGYHPDNTLERARVTTRSDGALYRYRAWTRSFWTTNGVTSSVGSGVTAWCYFKVDTTAPKEPQIIFPTNPIYSECTTDACKAAGGPGVAATFTIKPNAADTDITGFQWKLISEQTAHPETGSSATISPVPPLSGVQVLTVQAKDVNNRWGTPKEVAFKVAQAKGAVGRWHFADGTPGSTVTTAADSATEGLRHTATLHQQSGAKAATWSVMGRRGTGDYSLALNDDVTDPAQQIGYASTAEPPLNTKESFTISAWALLTNTSENRVVVSAPGASGTLFHLYYSATAKRWGFNRAATDVQDPAYVTSWAETSNPPAKVWTHLTGVFDTKGDDNKANDTIQLFINGRPQGAPVVLAAANTAYIPTASTQGMFIGRAMLGRHFFGRIDEVAVWDRPLTADEIREESALKEERLPAVELVGYWDASMASGSTVPQRAPYAGAGMSLSSTGATLDPGKCRARHRLRGVRLRIWR